jgi:hypothetical protein
MMFSRCAAIAALLLTGCKVCEDGCNEYVELAFFSLAADGTFASTSYEITANAGVETVKCTFDLDAGSADCAGQADAWVDAGDGSGEEGTGGFDDGKQRLVMRWLLAPDMFSVTVRDATMTTVLDNTLTPAYQDQGVHACDGQCRSFENELPLPAM